MKQWSCNTVCYKLEESGVFFQWKRNINVTPVTNATFKLFWNFIQQREQSCCVSWYTQCVPDSFVSPNTYPSEVSTWSWSSALWSQHWKANQKGLSVFWPVYVHPVSSSSPHLTSTWGAFILQVHEGVAKDYLSLFSEFSFFSIVW